MSQCYTNEVLGGARKHLGVAGEEVSYQQGALCGVAIQLGDVRHPWRPLDQVVLEWADVQLISSVRRSVQRSIKQFLAIAQINITRKRFDNSNILNRTN